MRTYFDCIPCFIRQAIDSVKLITYDEAIHEQVLRRVLGLASEMNFYQTPPAMAQKINRVIRQLTGIDDPYKEMKKHFNAFALELYPRLQKVVFESEDPFETARFAWPLREISLIWVSKVHWRYQKLKEVSMNRW